MYLKYRIHSGGYTFKLKGVYLYFNLEILPFFSLQHIVKSDLMKLLGYAGSKASD